MTGDTYARFVSPYHPDALREPDVTASDLIGDRRRLALVWNVFRTFEQLYPPFWLRRLIARLCGLSEGAAFAPHTALVRCWHTWPLTPAAMMRRGKRAPIPVDIVIDAEDLVLALRAPRLAELAATLADTAETGLLELAEAVSWQAGVRHAYAGIVLPPEADESTWIPRVQRRQLMVLRALRDQPHAANLRGCGVLTWTELRAVLGEASGEELLPARERELAAGTTRWMTRVLGASVPASQT